jgi:ATP synthase protein I
MDNPENKKMSSQQDFPDTINKKVNRKIAARTHTNNELWHGIGTMGIVGWSVAIPTLLGIALGIWLDNKITDSYSWTLMMLFAGLLFGCTLAWHWIAKEQKEIHRKRGDGNGK